MHITLEADYAVRIVIYLAQQAKRIDANTIAQNTGVTLRFALKILRNLVSCGMVKSFKGIQGGYEMNKAPDEITLKELLEAVESEYVFSRCLGGSACTNPTSSDCKAQKVFRKISDTVKKMLSEVTIEDLL